MQKRIVVTTLMLLCAAIIFLFPTLLKAAERTLTGPELESRTMIADEAYRLFKMGNFEQALEFARAAYEIDQENMASLANLAALYVALNDMQQAAPLLDTLQARKNEVCAQLAEAERRYAPYKKRWESSQKLSPEEMQARAELQELGRQCPELLSLLDDAQAGKIQKRSSGHAAR